MKNLRGANAILTGASRGIGPYIARRLAKDGVNVVLAARDASKLEATRAEVAALGVRAIAVATDVTSMDALRNLVATTERELGPIDILVNNAGIEILGAVQDYTFEQIDSVVRTNLNAPIWLTRMVLPGMLARNRGAVVQMSSLAGKSVSPYNSIYSATKHGLNGFTQSLNLELHGTKVHSGVVCPGFVADAGMWANTGQKAPRMAREVSPQKVADGVMKVIAGSTEVLVSSGPIRPLLALVELFPGLAGPVIRRMGVVDVFRNRPVGENAPERETADITPR